MFTLALALTSPGAAAEGLFGSMSEAKLAALAERIRYNETGGNDERLLWWNQGESFPSLGIGHFIWYPAGNRGPFEESFPSLLAFLEARGTELPPWLNDARGAPWSSRADWQAALDAGDPRLAGLRRLLMDSVPQQAAFLLQRFEREAAVLFDGLPAFARERLKQRLQRVAQSPGGPYALVDYLNFKGSGRVASERYEGQGWGLLQVLSAMSDDRSTAPTELFAEAAGAVLRVRVVNSPPARNEARWLPGWLRRVDGYR